MSVCGIQNIEGYSQADYRALGVRWAIGGALLALASVGALYKRTRPGLVFSTVAIPASALCFYRAHAYFQVEELEEEERVESDVELIELPTIGERVPTLKEMLLEQCIDTLNPAEIPTDLHDRLFELAIQRGISSFRRLLPLLQVTSFNLVPLRYHMNDEDLRAIAQHQETVRELRVSSPHVTFEALKPLLTEELSHLQLRFVGPDTPELLEYLKAHCPNLVHLEISGEVNVESLRSFPRLQHFKGRLDASNFSGDPIPCLENLETLEICRGEVPGPRILDQCTHLRELRSWDYHPLRVPAACAGTLERLYCHDAVEWPQGEIFGKLHTLKILNAHCWGWDAEALQARLPALRSLKLGVVERGTVPLTAVVAKIGQLAPQLRDFEVDTPRNENDRPFAEVWREVGIHLPNLESLAVGWGLQLDLETAHQVLASPMRVKLDQLPWIEGLSLTEMLSLCHKIEFADDQAEAFYRAALHTPRVSGPIDPTHRFTSELAALLQPTDVLKVRTRLSLVFNRSNADDAIKVLRHCPHVSSPRLGIVGGSPLTVRQWEGMGRALSRILRSFLLVHDTRHFGFDAFAALVRNLDGGAQVNLQMPPNITAEEAIAALEASSCNFTLQIGDQVLHEIIRARFPEVVR